MLAGTHRPRNGYFGFSVAMTSNLAVVSAPGENNGAGAAYVFARSGILSKQSQRIADPAGIAKDLFGYSVAISGNTIVVGAPGTKGQAGAVYVYVRSGRTFKRRATLASPEGSSPVQFGRSVAVTSDTLVVGAPTSKVNFGAVFVYAGSLGTWSPSWRVLGSAGTYFGAYVAASAQRIALSSPNQVHIYDRSSGRWLYQATLTVPNAANGYNYQDTPAISGSTIVVGAPSNHNSTGAAVVFTRSGNRWVQRVKLQKNPAPRNLFGVGVAISGPWVVVGAPFKGTGRCGQAVAFKRSGRTWKFARELDSTKNCKKNDLFGYSIAISGQTILVGVPGLNHNTGTVRVTTP